MIEFTPWLAEPPARAGWYNASAEFNPTTRRYFDGNVWAAPVDEAASDAAHAAALATPSCVQSIYWRGLTRRSHDWLQAELAG